MLPYTTSCIRAMTARIMAKTLPKPSVSVRVEEKRVKMARRSPIFCSRKLIAISHFQLDSQRPSVGGRSVVGPDFDKSRAFGQRECDRFEAWSSAMEARLPDPPPSGRPPFSSAKGFAPQLPHPFLRRNHRGRDG